MRHVPFEMVTEFEPAGDQPKAIEQLTEGLNTGARFQTLLGITGSGKSATIAWTIEQVQRPTLVIAPNKSLAAQLANELREFFPNNRVEYFVSYYDYYQPEAYMPSSDTYIEKDSSVNDEIDRLRHASTSALLTRRDVIIVASVSCIYGLGAPDELRRQPVGAAARPRDRPTRHPAQAHRHALRAQRHEPGAGQLPGQGRRHRAPPGLRRERHPHRDVRRRDRSDPSGRRFDRRTVGHARRSLCFPGYALCAGDDRMAKAIATIQDELQQRLAYFEENGKLLEAQRLRMRTEYDLEMMEEIGFCNGIENYSRHIDGRAPGEAPYTLLDYFPKDFVTVLDESHVAVPQLHGQYAGDRKRKEVLIEHGFRLPSAADNRPLNFDEVMGRLGQVVFLSATPGDYELDVSDQIVEQIVRPTGLVDPLVEVRPTKGQIDDLIEEINKRTERDERVLVTTLTKKMSEDLTDYLLELGIRVRYLHSEVDTIERIEILRDLRLGEFDVLVGINLLREGLDLPEVSLVAILDADKEGFLRSETSLIQTMGRAARNVDGHVVMYADQMTRSMTAAIGETQRRRAVQQAYNEEHGIDPQTITKAVTDILAFLRPNEQKAPSPNDGKRSRKRDKPLADISNMHSDDLERLVRTLEEEMNEAAGDLRFEYAARLRDEIKDLKREMRESA